MLFNFEPSKYDFNLFLILSQTLNLCSFSYLTSHKRFKNKLISLSICTPLNLSYFPNCRKKVIIYSDARIKWKSNKNFVTHFLSKEMRWKYQILHISTIYNFKPQSYLLISRHSMIYCRFCSTCFSHLSVSILFIVYDA